MSREEVLHVRLAPEHAERAAMLREQLAAAAYHLERSGWDDRRVVMRYEIVASQLEGLAFDALAGGGQTLPVPDDESVTITWPFAIGAPSSGLPARDVRPPSDMWRASDPRASRTQATRERFATQVSAWANRTAGAGHPDVNPSGIQNRALTTVLRRYAEADGGSVVHAPITYRDGSSARPFPLRSVKLADEVPADGREELRFTLMSVRHFEMDREVDGAWLRNREVSIRRPLAQTDELVYGQSMAQLASLVVDGPLTIHLYQTGLEVAIVGFYRALVDFRLAEGRETVCVIPYFFAGRTRFERGTPWTFL
ncbi:hypothetical protein C5C41_05120 [Rathayibacter sp. AY1E9]|uniref:hypothetical protein n=1 Tax=Rathayibacter sp. AY1E9 TaxID=2080556 RepID=UPI000CE87C8A|nr:hypothetical protein [Rathayibacter sp. AY1E9]PPG54225.1 hypothetical protein C5C41_05120 [Rathayibacter sp. AY1E9]